MSWSIKHKSGRILFVTDSKVTADNRKEMGWIVEGVKMTSREQFEHQCRNGLINGGLAVFENGVYVSELTRAVWSGWQASRAAIEIDLPEWYFCDVCPVFDKDEVIEALESAGLKVKK